MRCAMSLNYSLWTHSIDYRSDYGTGGGGGDGRGGIGGCGASGAAAAEAPPSVFI